MPSPITHCKFSEDDRSFSLSDHDKGVYTLNWDVGVNDENLAGVQVIEYARALIAGSGIDPVAKYGDFYSFMGTQDSGALAQSFTGKLKDVSDPFNWTFSATYGPPPTGESAAKTQEPNPLKWPAEYWIEWIEEQIPLEKAYCMTKLDQIKRGPNYLEAEPGPIVNACGQQTIDPVMRTLYHPVVCALINFPSYLNAARLNALYLNTMNSVDFLEDPPHTWRYLIADAGRKQNKVIRDLTSDPQVDLTIDYYPTTIKIEYRKETWDKFVLNNGMTTFEYLTTVTPDPAMRGQQPDKLKLVTRDGKPTTIADENSMFSMIPVWAYAKDGSKDSKGSFNRVDCAEPQLLNFDGVQLLQTSWAGEPLNPEAKYIQYRYLEEKDYNEMRYGTATPPNKVVW